MIVSLLLSVVFSCGLFIAVAHVANRGFVAPAYDVAANLLAFGSATAASLLLGNWTSAALSAAAIGCWLMLGLRTFQSRRAVATAVSELDRPMRPVPAAAPARPRPHHPPEHPHHPHAPHRRGPHPAPPHERLRAA
jgi:hypothetical protein